MSTYVYCDISVAHCARDFSISSLSAWNDYMCAAHVVDLIAPAPSQLQTRRVQPSVREAAQLRL